MVYEEECSRKQLSTLTYNCDSTQKNMHFKEFQILDRILKPIYTIAYDKQHSNLINGFLEYLQGTYS